MTQTQSDRSADPATSKSAQTAPAPANVERVLELLATLGPTQPADLSERLRAQRCIVSEALIRKLPARFGHLVQLNNEGQLELVAAPDAVDEAAVRLSKIGPIRWDDLAFAAPVAEGGLDYVGSEGSPASSDVRWRGVKAVVAYAPGVSSLKELARRTGYSVDVPDLPVADLALLALLLQPSGEARELPDLLTAYGLDANDRSHSAIESLAKVMAASVDGPNWAFAIDVLAAAGDPWGAILTAPSGQVAQTLDVAGDPLLSFPSRAGGVSATLGLETTFDLIGKSEELTLRPQQTDMARSIAEHFDAGYHLAVEAPTGTGKTLAYLMPALSQAAHPARPVIIATKTKMLQRQLRSEMERLAALGLVNAPYRELYGVRNYVCARELLDGVDNGEQAHQRAWAWAAAIAARALGESESGTWDEVNDGVLGRQSSDYRVARERLRTDAPGCDGSHCPAAGLCPLVARHEGLAKHPGIIATNHAMVGAWTSDDSASGIGPLDSDQICVVFDEAHDLEDSLAAAWTQELTVTTMRRLSADLRGSSGRSRRAHRVLVPSGLRSTWLSDLRRAGQELEAGVSQLSHAVEAYSHEYSAKGRGMELRQGIATRRPEFAQIRAAAAQTVRSLAPVRTLLKEAADHQRLARQQKGATDESLRRAARALQSLSEHCEEIRTGLSALQRLEEGHRLVHLLECSRNDAGDIDWSYRQIPIEVSDLFRRRILEASHSTVLTSATLAVAGSFDFIADRLGLSVADPAERERRADAVTTQQLRSPFDFAEQSMVVLTSYLPIPVPVNEVEFCEEVAAEAAGLLSLTEGRTLSLFAAKSRLESVADHLAEHRDELQKRGVSLLVQGRDAPLEIRRRFTADEGTALLGLRTYWEGFDAPGRTLSYLQIEKAPYPSPDDPITAARGRAVSARGGDAFLDYTVPRTAIQLAQGFGRLIRSPQDRGAAFVLDRRMQFPSAANEMLLSSLPGAQIHYARDREDAWTTAIRFVDGAEPDLTQALAVRTSDAQALVDSLRLDMNQPLEPQLGKAARELFGIEQLSQEQLDLMTAVITGKDAIGILPTGAGKSLVFQLPAVLRPDDRATLVVSPLVALIKDQVDSLRVRNHLRMVAGITGRTSASERTEILRDLADGRVRLLYVSPERLVADVALREALSQSDLGMVVVDEAHCISSWGHDFRPEFRQIARSLRDFRRSPRLALTATATPDVEQDTGEVLGLDSPVIVRRPVARADLRYRVMEVGRDIDKLQEILRIVEKDTSATGLVYVSRRALADELAWNLRQAGIAARAYHAGMDPQQRESVQDDFLDGTTRVVVATKAFGMGINKPDIAWVVHYDPSESLESYAQESGRAARSPAITGDCLLLVKKGDIVRRLKLVDSDNVGQILADVEAVWQRLMSAGSDILLDPEKVRGEVGLDLDRLSVILGWLERTGHLERMPNCATAGMVGHGFGQPEDDAERKLFLRVKLEQLSLRVGARRRVADLAELADNVGLRREELETHLISWTLQRFLTFQPTQTRWRLRRHRDDLHVDKICTLIKRWQGLEKQRIWELNRYITDSETCRRVSMARVFGDDPVACDDLSAVEQCDVCSDVSPGWHSVPVEDIPDPEELIDINSIVLQAVRWANGSKKRQYGLVGLRHALIGQDTYSDGRPLGNGLLACPHFGALAYLRSAGRRFDDAVTNLRSRGLVDQRIVTTERGEYNSLHLTATGESHLTGVKTA